MVYSPNSQPKPKPYLLLVVPKGNLKDYLICHCHTFYYS